MTQPAIQVEGLWKEYTVGVAQGPTTFREMLVAKFRRQEPSRTEKFWALKDVSFDVRQGEVLGVIGRNGAGKSTLLKVLSRITEPTHGRAHIRGRVSSLLEVGTGFHPELTGRENILLNGAILGMTRREILSKLDAIIAFAEVERFIDTPIKHYSSGMYVRLAFAVAAHLESDILLVDEVLAVGDLRFQQKCLAKMGEIGRGGRTVVFVSHNLGAIRRQCGWAVWMGAGSLQATGPTDEVIRQYIDSSVDLAAANAAQRVVGAGEASLLGARVCQPEDHAASFVDITRPFHIDLDIDVRRPLPELNVGIVISTIDGNVVLHSADTFSAQPAQAKAAGRWRIRCTLPAYALNVGTYALAVAADIPMVKMAFAEEQALTFKVEATCQTMGRYGGAWQGVVGPGIARWQSSRPEGS